MNKSRHPARRVAIKLAVCLLLGAVVTVGVAWVRSQLPPPSPRAFLFGEGIARWPITVPNRWPATPQDYTYSTGIGFRRDDWVTRESTGYYYVREFTFGWPWPSLTHLGVYEFQSAENSMILRQMVVEGTQVVWLNGVEAPTGNNLPVRPRPIPFLGDALAFAAPIGMIWFGVPALRRVLRRRGGCVKCGYDLKGLPAGAPCPECGRARETMPPG